MVVLFVGEIGSSDDELAHDVNVDSGNLELEIDDVVELFAAAGKQTPGDKTP